MMPHLARRPVNLTIESALVDDARALGIPLSATLEAALRARVRQERERRWLEENRQAVEDYNARIVSEGAFGEQFENI